MNAQPNYARIARSDDEPSDEFAAAVAKAARNGQPTVYVPMPIRPATHPTNSADSWLREDFA